MSAWTSHNTRFTKSIVLSFLVLGLGCSDSASNNQTNNQSNNGSNNTTKQTNNSTGSTTSTSSTTLTSGTTTTDGTPQISNLPSLESVAIKLFRFGWEDVSDATYYQILENKDGDSDFVQVGEDVLPGVKTIDIEVPLCLRTNAVYKLRSCNDSGCTDSEPVNVSGNLAEAIGYFKAENAGVRDFFGSAIALSADGKLLAVGAPQESSRDSSDETDDAWVEAGAVYIFTQSSGKWTQQAFLKASNADRYDNFGEALSLTSDGKTLVVGAPSEDGRFANDPSDNSRPDSGAAYVFEREGSTWTETKYIKLEKDVQGRAFGQHVHISDDGLSIIAVEYNPFSGGTSVNLLTKSNDEWVLEPGFSKPNAGDIRFAVGTAFSNTGTVVAVGAAWESSDAIGIGGDQDNENLSRSGAVFLYELENGVWGETYIKADIPVERTEFGLKVRLSGDGETLAVLGLGKVAAADTDIIGLIYLYKKTNGVWELNHKFPSTVYTNFSDMSLNEDGSLIALSLEADQSSSAGLNGDRTASESTYGAAFVHQFDNGAWTEVAYVKASNPTERDNFGRYLFMGNDGTLVVGVPNEASSATGVGRDQNNEDAEFSGAVYLY